MTDVHVTGYGDRIAEAAAADGLPWKLTPAQAAALAARYGVTLAAHDEAVPLRQVGAEIAAKIFAIGA